MANRGRRLEASDDHGPRSFISPQDVQTSGRLGDRAGYWPAFGVEKRQKGGVDRVVTDKDDWAVRDPGGHLGQRRPSACQHGFQWLDTGCIVDGAPGCVDVFDQPAVLRPVVPVEKVIADLYRQPAGNCDRFGGLHGPAQRAGDDRQWRHWLERRRQGFSLLATSEIEFGVRETTKTSTRVEHGLPVTTEIDARHDRPGLLLVAVNNRRLEAKFFPHGALFASLMIVGGVPCSIGSLLRPISARSRREGTGEYSAPARDVTDGENDLSSGVALLKQLEGLAHVS